jgi:hypothetical protein
MHQKTSVPIFTQLAPVCAGYWRLRPGLNCSKLVGLVRPVGSRSSRPLTKRGELMHPNRTFNALCLPFHRCAPDVDIMWMHVIVVSGRVVLGKAVSHVVF